MSWCDAFRDICRPDVPLAPLTWYQLGGPARWLAEPRSTVELAALLAALRDADVPWRVLGCGANVLVRDEGFNGVVIRLAGAAFDEVRFDGARVTAGAGADFPRLIRTTLARGLVGLEVLAGVPGTVGGLVRMNAGGKYGEIRQFVVGVRVVDPRAGEQRWPAERIGFGYRHTALDGVVVVEAEFELRPGDSEAALRRHRDIWTEKHATQPPWRDRSAGCVFRNPPGESAGRLLDRAGLKGTRVGDVEISHQHANFIVAGPQARASDVIELIQIARRRVREQTGIELEPEVELW